MDQPEPVERVEDEVQSALHAWVRHGDRVAGERAAKALMVECRPRVARFMRGAAPDRLDDELQAAMVHLCAFGAGARPAPRALAPDGCNVPRAHRRKVLKNFLIDRWRRLELRIHANDAAGNGVNPVVFAHERRSQRQARDREAEAHRRPFGHGRRSAAESEKAPVEGAGPAWSAAPPTDSSTDGETVPHHARDDAKHDPRNDVLSAITLREKRAQVGAGLATLRSPRRAMAAALALRADPTPFIENLARDLDEDIDVVRERVLLAEKDYDADAEGLTEAMVRVLYPAGPLLMARDGARHLLDHAVEFLRRLHADQQDQEDA
ncbi:hypothetical protein LBMAG42_56450 [Deltaproteobacteria bacterium]|nr:hypothetical protein LBMAG42_56450 [Deltaproteobacteria bacterium]